MDFSAIMCKTWLKNSFGLAAKIQNRTLMTLIVMTNADYESFQIRGELEKSTHFLRYAKTLKLLTINHLNFYHPQKRRKNDPKRLHGWKGVLALPAGRAVLLHFSPPASHSVRTYTVDFLLPYKIHQFLPFQAVNAARGT